MDEYIAPSWPKDFKEATKESTVGEDRQQLPEEPSRSGDLATLMEGEHEEHARHEVLRVGGEDLLKASHRLMGRTAIEFRQGKEHQRGFVEGVLAIGEGLKDLPMAPLVEVLPKAIQFRVCDGWVGWQGIDPGTMDV